MGAWVKDARARGYEKVILLGWSGGGSLSLFYQAEAVSIATFSMTRPLSKRSQEATGGNRGVSYALVLPGGGGLTLAATGASRPGHHHVNLPAPAFGAPHV